MIWRTAWLSMAPTTRQAVTHWPWHGTHHPPGSDPLAMEWHEWQKSTNSMCEDMQSTPTAVEWVFINYVQLVTTLCKLRYMSKSSEYSAQPRSDHQPLPGGVCGHAQPVNNIYSCRWQVLRLRAHAVGT